MSRAGRQARMRRLIAAGEWAAPDWTPSASLKPPRRTAAAVERHRRQQLAEREAWLAAFGTHGWQREQVRRRALRNARLRRQRLDREASASGPQPREGIAA